MFLTACLKAHPTPQGSSGYSSGLPSSDSASEPGRTRPQKSLAPAPRGRGRLQTPHTPHCSLPHAPADRS